jgi:purine-binding chemotaxis protein CheW
LDILAARKKAAERSRIAKQEEHQPVPDPQPAVRPEPPAAESEPKAALPVVAREPEQVDPAPEIAGPEQEAPASETAVEQPPVQEVEMLSFRLGPEEYVLGVDSVKEVLKNRELTPLPNAADYIIGVTALRGPVLPVIDLCKRLNIPPGVRDEKSRILVVSANEEDTGIIVDRVTGVIKIDPASVKPAPETIEQGSEFLRGIVRKDDKLYILLALEKALAVE